MASAVATAVSQLSFVVMYGAELAGPQLAGVVAFVLGAVPKFVLSRWWAWQRRGMPRLLTEVAPYLLVAVGTGLVAGALTGLAETAIARQVSSHDLQVGLVGAAFFVVMGATFVLRYVLFDRVVFNGRSRSIHADA